MRPAADLADTGFSPIPFLQALRKLPSRERRRLAGISNAPAKAYPEKRGREAARFNLFVDCIKSAGGTLALPATALSRRYA